MSTENGVPATRVHDVVHTPGPWRVSHQNGDALPGFQGLVGVVGPEQTNSRGHKFTLYVAQYIRPDDAKLIAAAPDLLAACELVKLWMVGGMPGPHSDSVVLEQVKLAIQKAS